MSHGLVCQVRNPITGSQRQMSNLPQWRQPKDPEHHEDIWKRQWKRLAEKFGRWNSPQSSAITGPRAPTSVDHRVQLSFLHSLVITPAPTEYHDVCLSVQLKTPS